MHPLNPAQQRTAARLPQYKCSPGSFARGLHQPDVHYLAAALIPCISTLVCRLTPYLYMT